MDSSKEKPPIIRRGFPLELINELFGSMPLQNAFVLLAKMTNGLLARNVQKMINGIKEKMMNNKLNSAESAGFAISEEGLVAKQSAGSTVNCIRALLPISSINLAVNKPTIAFYFEVQILNKPNGFMSCIHIGFCNQQFPLQGKWLGYENNSIGIYSTGGIWIDECLTNFKNDYGFFKEGDFIGLGIIQQPNSTMESFATWNGNFLEKTKLSSTFAHLRLFPAVNLYHSGDLIRANFGKDEWQFKDFKCILE